MREHGTNAVGPPPDGEGFMDFRPASVRRCTKGLCRTLRAAGKSGIEASGSTFRKDKPPWPVPDVAQVSNLCPV